MEKSPVNFLFARCLCCLSPEYTADCPEPCEAFFQKILEKLVPYKHLPAKESDLAKLQYSIFLSNTMKVNKNDLVKFSKVIDRIDIFLFKYIGEKNRYINMFQDFKMLLILLDGQTQVEHGFSFNSKILVENLQMESLVAQRHVTDHIHYKNIHAYELTMAKKELDNVKEALSCYFTSLKKKFQPKLQSDKQEKLKALNDSINEIKQQTSVQLLKSTFIELRTDTDKAVLSAEKKTSLQDV